MCKQLTRLNILRNPKSIYNAVIPTTFELTIWHLRFS